MPRSNKSKFALLGLLGMAPMSGYDIKRAIEHSIGYFWHESYGAIYPNLRSLLKDGLASRTVEPGEGKPDRHVYTITEKGREELHAWLAKHPTPQPLRNELLLKLFYGPFGKRKDMEHHVNAFLRIQRSRVKQLESILRQIIKQYEGNPGLPYWSMTLRYGILNRKALIEWGEETLKILENLDEGPVAHDLSLGNPGKQE